MQLQDQVKKRFADLAESFKGMPFEKNSMGSGSHVPDGQWHGWASSSQHLIRAAFGDKSSLLTNFTAAYDKCNGDGHRVRTP